MFIIDSSADQICVPGHWEDQRVDSGEDLHVSETAVQLSSSTAPVTQVSFFLRVLSRQWKQHSARGLPCVSVYIHPIYSYIYGFCFRRFWVHFCFQYYGEEMRHYCTFPTQRVEERSKKLPKLWLLGVLITNLWSVLKITADYGRLR